MYRLGKSWRAIFLIVDCPALVRGFFAASKEEFTSMPDGVGLRRADGLAIRLCGLSPTVGAAGRCG